MTVPLGVGILGAGPVTQAIHLPTLAGLSELFRVVHVMDVDVSIAEKVARRADARWSQSVDEVMADPAVDVVAICSPPQFHAEQVLAAIAAGKKGILCEKPFAVSWDEATTLAKVAQRAKIPLLVAAMHTFDPGWLAAEPWIDELTETAHSVRSSIALPMNDRFEDSATEILGRPASVPLPDTTDPAAKAAVYRSGILGLAIHDLPLVRTFAPHIDTIGSVDVLAPFGYLVSAFGPAQQVTLFGHMSFGWKPNWTFDVWSANMHLRLRFAPSYVHAGSAEARITVDGQTRKLGPFTDNGYTGEWVRLAALVRDGAQDAAELQRFIGDLTYALTFADAMSSLDHSDPTREERPS